MFRFSIRDVLWLTALASLGCAWWMDHHFAEIRIRGLVDYVQPHRPLGGVIRPNKPDLSVLEGLDPSKLKADEPAP
jgi:hypothetical protein